MSSAGTLILVGAEAAMGAEILARMVRDGYRVITADAGDAVALEAAVASVPELAVLVVNLPITRTGLRFNEVDDSAFAAAMQHQLFDVVRAAQTVLPRMRGGGRIVHVSARGHLGAWGGVHLMAAGAALAAMTRSMALELEGEGIRVNLIATGFVGERTDTAQRRAAVAHAVSFFAAAEGGASGETLLLDGHAGLRMAESRRPRQPAIQASLPHTNESP